MTIFTLLSLCLAVILSFASAGILPEKLSLSASGHTKLGSFRYSGKNGQVLESTYYLSNGRSWWDTAMTTCKESGLGSLLSIESQEEDAIIRELIRREPYSVWTSGSFESGSWRWASTNQQIGYVNWRTSVENNPSYRIDIVTNPQDGSYGWSATAKTVTKKHICEQTLVI